MTVAEDESSPVVRPSARAQALESAALFEHSLEGVLFTAPDGRVLAANDAACRMLRRTQRDICRLGRSGLADPTDARWAGAVEERTRTGRFVGRLSFVRGDASTVEIDLSSAVFESDGGDERTVVVMREVIGDASVGDLPRLAPDEIDRYAAGVLTRREVEVLSLLAARHSYQEIARALFVSFNTVKSHVARIYQKLGVNNRKQAVDRARAAGLLPPARSVSRRSRFDREPVDFGRITLVAQALTGAVDVDEMLEIVVMQGLGGLHADAAIVTFTVDDFLVPVANHGYTEAAVTAFFPAQLSAAVPLTVAAREQTMVWVPNRDDAQQRFPVLAASPAARSHAWIAAPLVAQGRPFGAFGVSFMDPHDFDEEERAYLRTLSDLCSLALHRERDNCLLPRADVNSASMVMRLRRGVGWPNGAWMLRDVSPAARRRLIAIGCEVMEYPGGRMIVEPPST